jgi:2-C-methyl-D-erythritol 2,4-cyclodiphosphate synthase
MQIRIGVGYDVHRLEPGMPFMLGGIKIPYSKGAIGHSDADVLIHAICDALLGAANLRDIGCHNSVRKAKTRNLHPADDQQISPDNGDRGRKSFSKSHNN